MVKLLRVVKCTFRSIKWIGTWRDEYVYTVTNVSLQTEGHYLTAVWVSYLSSNQTKGHHLTAVWVSYLSSNQTEGHHLTAVWVSYLSSNQTKGHNLTAVWVSYLSSNQTKGHNLTAVWVSYLSSNQTKGHNLTAVWVSYLNSNQTEGHHLTAVWVTYLNSNNTDKNTISLKTNSGSQATRNLVDIHVLCSCSCRSRILGINVFWYMKSNFRVSVCIISCFLNRSRVFLKDAFMTVCTL